MPRRVTDSPPLKTAARAERHPGRLGGAAPLGSRELRPIRRGPDWGLAAILVVLAAGAGAIGWYGYQLKAGSGPAPGETIVYAPRPNTTIPGQAPGPDGAAQPNGWTPTPQAPAALEQVQVNTVGTHAVPAQTQSRHPPRQDNASHQLGTLRTTEPPKD